MDQVLNFLASVDAAGVAVTAPVSPTSPLPVTGPAGGLLATVTGNVASGAADAGNPVKVAGVFNVALLNFLDGQRADLQVNSHGALLAQSVLPSGLPPTSFAAGADGQANAASGYVSYNRPEVFNGVSWDRAAKPRTAFRLSASAASNNAANIKATPGNIYAISAMVTAAVPTGAYLKFFDTAGVPNPAAQAPLYAFSLTYNTGPVGSVNILLPAQGLFFPTGIGVAIVGGAADLDNTAIAVGQVLSVNIPFS